MDVFTVVAGLVMLWFVVGLLYVAVSVRRMSCWEFLRRYGGLSGYAFVFGVVAVPAVIMGGLLVLYLSVGLALPLLVPAVVVAVGYVFSVLYARRVYGVCRSRVGGIVSYSCV